MIINKELHFDDLSCFWSYAMQESSANRKSSRENHSLHWSGGLSWEQAKQMAISGWRDGMNKIEKYRAQIMPIIAEKILRPQQIYAIAGYNVDIGNFLANNPECFIAREYEEKNYPGRVYKIVCSISFSAAIKPETIIQRGAMICAMIDAIEFAGHRAEVICNAATSISGIKEYRQGKNKERGWFETSVIVKKSSQPLEMTDLAFCLAHPSMLRKIIFSVCELNGWSDIADGYGSPAEATEKGDIYIREVFSETVPDEQAITWVLKELEKLGINLETN